MMLYRSVKFKVHNGLHVGRAAVTATLTKSEINPMHGKLIVRYIPPFPVTVTERAEKLRQVTERIVLFLNYDKSSNFYQRFKKIF